MCLTVENPRAANAAILPLIVDISKTTAYYSLKLRKCIPEGLSFPENNKYKLSQQNCGNSKKNKDRKSSKKEA